MGTVKLIQYALTIAVFVTFIVMVYYICIALKTKKYKYAKKWAVYYVAINLVRLIYEIIFEL